MAFISVDGTITRSFYENKGFEVTETYTTKDGETRSNRYTVWFTQAQNLNVGDEGKFSGTLSTKIDAYTNKDGEAKTAVVVAINNATAKIALPAGAPASKPVDEDDLAKYGTMPF